MKSTVVVFVCILYCCQAGVVTKDAVFVDGQKEPLPAVTVVTTETTKLKDAKENSSVKSIGPTIKPNTTTVSPPPTTPNVTTVTPSTSTPNVTTVTPPSTPPTPTSKTTTVTPPPTSTNATTVTPHTPSTRPTKPTTAKPIPSSTSAPITSTTAVPPTNRGFDGPSFIGGIVLASGLMAIGFVALKFYRARTELNYHTL